MAGLGLFVLVPGDSPAQPPGRFELTVVRLEALRAPRVAGPLA
jgi:hypothetical protein